ncbi:Protein kinase, putative [Hondaea fermentalgiana]|uniref:Protein kinase, putative n=1 Tax=Hondaea fermentalgiana TaxID=2315210 RepID=A0A2R5H0W1_9STRA|nr:Protein kinase, putative [Hondaea fermentalgiana]|eukprot:GBG34703.1 Protein kinase, putative [Hondaea fermentalgiana]
MASFLFGSAVEKRVLGDFEVGETLGEGMTSKVKCGKHKRTGQLVALKIMDPDTFKSREVQRELEILRYFGEPQNRHPNVSGLVTVLHDVDFPSKHGEKSSYLVRRVSVIVTEYMDSGDLFSYLSSGIPFNEETARAVFQQVVRGLSHLHKHGVVHLDLKPENILLGKNGIVKIADFGLSEVVKPLRTSKHGKKSRRQRLVGSHCDRASEHASGARSVAGGGSRRSHRRVVSSFADMRTVASLTSLSSINSSASLDSSPSPSPSPLVHLFPPNSRFGGANAIPSSGASTSASSIGRMPSFSLSSYDEGGGQLLTVKASLGDGIYDLDATPQPNPDALSPEHDEQLFAAITKGKTRRAAASDADIDAAVAAAATRSLSGESTRGGSMNTTSTGASTSASLRGSHSVSNLLSMYNSTHASHQTEGHRNHFGERHHMGAKTVSYNSISSLDSDGSIASRGSESRSVARFKTPKLVVNSRSGTLSYQAPEVAKGRYCGSKADVYSLGVVLHVMLFGVLPYEEGEWIRRRDYYERSALVSDDGSSPGDADTADTDLSSEDELTLVPWTTPNLLQRDVHISEEAKDLLASMLWLGPETRFSLKDVMRHPWVDASRLRGSVQKVAAVVKRREPYVLENRKNQTYMRKARKRGYGPHVVADDDALFL